MDLNDFQEFARETAIYPNLGSNLAYPALGLAGEAGEVCNKVKKIYRDCDGVLGSDKAVEIGKELGDVLWYVAACCSEIGLRMSDVAEASLSKLKKRQQEGKLRGDGDNR